MAAIPGPVLLIVGLGMALFSNVLNGRTTEFNGSYALFMYAGAIMAFYGFVKTLIWLMMRKSGREIREEAKHSAANVGANHGQMSGFEYLQRTDFDKERAAMTKRCPTCGFLYYAHANFCQNCGTRLR